MPLTTATGCGEEPGGFAVIVVMGVSGCGKSSLAERIAAEIIEVSRR